MQVTKLLGSLTMHFCEICVTNKNSGNFFSIKIRHVILIPQLTLRLLNISTSLAERSRLSAVGEWESGNWSQVLPSFNIGTLLDDTTCTRLVFLLFLSLWRSCWQFQTSWHFLQQKRQGYISTCQYWYYPSCFFTVGVPAVPETLCSWGQSARAILKKLGKQLNNFRRHSSS